MSYTTMNNNTGAIYKIDLSQFTIPQIACLRELEITDLENS